MMQGSVMNTFSDQVITQTLSVWSIENTVVLDPVASKLFMSTKKESVYEERGMDMTVTPFSDPIRVSPSRAQSRVTQFSSMTAARTAWYLVTYFT